MYVPFSVAKMNESCEFLFGDNVVLPGPVMKEAAFIIYTARDCEKGSLINFFQV